MAGLFYGFIGVLATAICLMFLYCFVLIGAMATGNANETYRCKDGVTQARQSYFGMSLSSWAAIDHDAIPCN